MKSGQIRDVCDAVSALVTRGWQSGHSDEITQQIVTAIFAGQIPHVRITPLTGSKDRRPIFDRLSEFYTEDEAWLLAPHPQLKNERAADIIMAGGAGKVHEIIDRLESGGYL